MTPYLHTARSVIAIALCGAASAAFAQTYTLISPPLPWAHQFVCTVTNVSNQLVSVQKVEIVDRGTVLYDGSNACTGPLVAGKRCITQSPPGGAVSRQPYCRVQYTGTEGAVVGSMYGNYQSHVGGPSYGAVTALPLQAVKTFPLAIAN